MLSDCSGVDDAYEDTFTASGGYLRLDVIDTGTDFGSFAGLPLTLQLEGHLHVWSEDGVDLRVYFCDPKRVDPTPSDLGTTQRPMIG